MYDRGYYRILLLKTSLIIVQCAKDLFFYCFDLFVRLFSRKWLLGVKEFYYLEISGA